ncbi:glycosyltransferase family 1 protein [Halobacteriales archaeon QS_4_62_28]|nr:MAG: glycosyltransferase family 1 protein [Halobacteriales archaeon QS_4_62_28]
MTSINTNATSASEDPSSPVDTEAQSEAVGSSEAAAGTVIGLEVLVVGTFGGGGIHSYIDKQVEWLDDSLSIATHDMGMPPVETGSLRFLQGLVIGVYAMLRFPFQSTPDIVHVHTSHRYSFYRSSMYVLFARYVWDVPVVLHIHGSSFDDFVTTESTVVAALQRHVFAVSTEIVVLSDYWEEILATRGIETKIRIIPNAVDPEIYPVKENETVPHIVFVSNLIERKGVRELAAALEQLSERQPDSFEASIAGDGPLSGRIERLAAEHDEVQYLGYISEERKRSLLGDGSIFVLPTYAEGLPIAMLEGMAGENAIISTNVGGIPDVIDDEQGIIVEPGDVDQLTSGLEELITAPERRHRMAANNRQAIEESYSWQEASEELIDLYKSHVSTGRRTQ